MIGNGRIEIREGLAISLHDWEREDREGLAISLHDWVREDRERLAISLHDWVKKRANVQKKIEK